MPRLNEAERLVRLSPKAAEQFLCRIRQRALVAAMGEVTSSNFECHLIATERVREVIDAANEIKGTDDA